MARRTIFSTATTPAPGKSVTWSGATGCANALALAEVAAASAGCVVAITATVAEAEQLEGQLRFFMGATGGCAILPDLEVLPYDSFSPHQDLVSTRLAVLRNLAAGSARLLLAAAPTLLPRLAPLAHLRKGALRISRDEPLGLDGFRHRLEQAGYRRVTQVSAPGDYSVRGSLIDFFPTGHDQPVRVDFLDEQVVSLRRFDPDTQLSAESIEAVDTLEAREFPTHADSIREFRRRYRRRFEGNPAASRIYREVSEGRLPGGVENYLPLFFDATATFCDYLPPTALVVEVGDVTAALASAWHQVVERHEQLGHDREQPLLLPSEVYAPPEEHQERLRTWPRILLGSPVAATGERAVVTLPAAPAPMLPCVSRQDDGAGELVAALLERKERVLLAVESASRREWLADALRQAGEAPQTSPDWQGFLGSAARFSLCDAPIGQGMALPESAIAVFGDQDLFGQPLKPRPRRRRGRDAEAVIAQLTDLRAGAPVVHTMHGIGRYVGLTQLDLDGAAGEFVTLEYAGGDRLHVPVSSLHLISRYTGAAPEQAPLHRLGTDQWQKARRRAAERIRDIAAELLDLYSRRAARQGHIARAEPAQYEAFAAGFPFALTDDQARAIDDVLADLASEQPMDRLVCGDVGFGKTEVALRAAFAAVASGRQVAVLVPTTLLAQQHYQTFADRFADWPVRVESLSRFRSPQEHRTVLEKAADGQVDIVVGTHRLLQADVRFKNLGLVIIDEEHRFGVRDKERLKNLRSEVDVLTLTATPIPRTLNMALGNIRELSLITTAPASRLAIRTFVSTWSAQLIREACLRELKRSGQVYFVHNRVQDIASVAEQVAAIVPEARIGIAHGQMPERDLERVMLDFYHRRFDLLICTAIIESGLDVPTANTIVIDHAEQFGLAQLHQLRGRVGRSHHQAFAYLIAPPRDNLQGDARKRLEALEALDDLGAGFVLATHDLEIRGAGELLGEDQSGQIQEIGFALYNEMLARTVQALRAGQEPDPAGDDSLSAEVDLHIPAFLPEEYLPDVHLRLVLYKRIASARHDADLDALRAELKDRFGHLPEATANLLALTALRLQARQAGIARIKAGPGSGSLEFAKGTTADPARIVALIQRDPRNYRLDPRQRLLFRAPMESPLTRIRVVTELLTRIGAPPQATAQRSPSGVTQ
ncbi:MAG: transcription-repair coupling factor [Gammaproteobacteria bacterium]|nr:transcription-repair coupling factor [Gammaproteobacteria bacterium]